MSNTKTANKKPTKAEVIQRVNAILSLLIEGQNRTTILEYAGKKWGVGRSSTDEYISRATKIFRQNAIFDRELEIGRGIQVRQMIIRESLEKKNYMQAICTPSDLDRFLGLYAATQKKVVVKQPPEMSVAELKALQTQLKKKLAA